MATSAASPGFNGSLAVKNWGTDYNAIRFLIEQITGRNATITLVQVKAVTGGGVGPVGTVDVQPMVNQIDGAGNATAHATIYGLPFLRLQGGDNAVILDPQVGDIGLAAFCSTDISAVKSAKKVSNPGSRRRYDWADGLYLGGFLNGTPEQYAEFAGGINIVSPGVSVSENLSVGNGASGTFSTPTGQVVTVLDGIVVDISP